MKNFLFNSKQNDYIENISIIKFMFNATLIDYSNINELPPGYVIIQSDQLSAKDLDNLQSQTISDVFKILKFPMYYDINFINKCVLQFQKYKNLSLQLINVGFIQIIQRVYIQDSFLRDGEFAQILQFLSLPISAEYPKLVNEIFRQIVTRTTCFINQITPQILEALLSFMIDFRYLNPRYFPLILHILDSVHSTIPEYEPHLYQSLSLMIDHPILSNLSETDFNDLLGHITNSLLSFSVSSFSFLAYLSKMKTRNVTKLYVETASICYKRITEIEGKSPYSLNNSPPISISEKNQKILSMKDFPNAVFPLEKLSSNSPLDFSFPIQFDDSFIQESFNFDYSRLSQEYVRKLDEIGKFLKASSLQCVNSFLMAFQKFLTIPSNREYFLPALPYFLLFCSFSTNYPIRIDHVFESKENIFFGIHPLINNIRSLYIKALLQCNKDELPHLLLSTTSNPFLFADLIGRLQIEYSSLPSDLFTSVEMLQNITHVTCQLLKMNYSDPAKVMLLFLFRLVSSEKIGPIALTNPIFLHNFCSFIFQYEQLSPSIFNLLANGLIKFSIVNYSPLHIVLQNVFNNIYPELINTSISFLKTLFNHRPDFIPYFSHLFYIILSKECPITPDIFSCFRLCREGDPNFDLSLNQKIKLFRSVHFNYQIIGSPLENSIYFYFIITNPEFLHILFIHPEKPVYRFDTKTGKIRAQTTIQKQLYKLAKYSDFNIRQMHEGEIDLLIAKLSNNEPIQYFGTEIPAQQVNNYLLKLMFMIANRCPSFQLLKNIISSNNSELWNLFVAQLETIARKSHIGHFLSLSSSNTYHMAHPLDKPFVITFTLRLDSHYLKFTNSQISIFQIIGSNRTVLTVTEIDYHLEFVYSNHHQNLPSIMMDRFTETENFFKFSFAPSQDKTATIITICINDRKKSPISLPLLDFGPNPPVIKFGGEFIMNHYIQHSASSQSINTGEFNDSLINSALRNKIFDMSIWGEMSLSFRLDHHKGAKGKNRICGEIINFQICNLFKDTNVLSNNLCDFAIDKDFFEALIEKLSTCSYEIAKSIFSVLKILFKYSIEAQNSFVYTTSLASIVKARFCTAEFYFILNSVYSEITKPSLQYLWYSSLIFYPGFWLSVKPFEFQLICNFIGEILIEQNIEHTRHSIGSLLCQCHNCLFDTGAPFAFHTTTVIHEEDKAEKFEKACIFLDLIKDVIKNVKISEKDTQILIDFCTNSRQTPYFGRYLKVVLECISNLKNVDPSFFITLLFSEDDQIVIDALKILTIIFETDPDKNNSSIPSNEESFYSAFFGQDVSHYITKPDYEWNPNLADIIILVSKKIDKISNPLLLIKELKNDIKLNEHPILIPFCFMLVFHFIKSKESMEFLQYFCIKKFDLKFSQIFKNGPTWFLWPILVAIQISDVETVEGILQFLICSIVNTPIDQHIPLFSQLLTFMQFLHKTTKYPIIQVCSLFLKLLKMIVSPDLSSRLTIPLFLYQFELEPRPFHSPLLIDAFNHSVFCQSPFVSEHQKFQLHTLKNGSDVESLVTKDLSKIHWKLRINDEFETPSLDFPDKDDLLFQFMQSIHNEKTITFPALQSRIEQTEGSLNEMNLTSFLEVMYIIKNGFHNSENIWNTILSNCTNDFIGYSLVTESKKAEILFPLLAQLGQRPYYKRDYSFSSTFPQTIKRAKLPKDPNLNIITYTKILKYYHLFKNTTCSYEIFPTKDNLDFEFRIFFVNKLKMKIIMLSTIKNLVQSPKNPNMFTFNIKNGSRFYQIEFADSVPDVFSSLLMHEEHKYQSPSYYQKRWLNHQISNFDYLIILNFLAGKSIRDESNYPLLPNLLSNLENRTICLHIPVANSSTTICLANIRLESSMISLSQQFSNYLFIAPDLYTFSPCIGTNLPKWAQTKDSFVHRMRTLLEAPDLDSIIPGWIDAVFGCLQRSNESKLFNNPHPMRDISQVLISPSSPFEFNLDIIGCKRVYFTARNKIIVLTQNGTLFFVTFTDRKHHPEIRKYPVSFENQKIAPYRFGIITFKPIPTEIYPLEKSGFQENKASPNCFLYNIKSNDNNNSNSYNVNGQNNNSPAFDLNNNSNNTNYGNNQNNNNLNTNNKENNPFSIFQYFKGDSSIIICISPYEAVIGTFNEIFYSSVKPTNVFRSESRIMKAYSSDFMHIAVFFTNDGYLSFVSTVTGRIISKYLLKGELVKSILITRVFARVVVLTEKAIFIFSNTGEKLYETNKVATKMFWLGIRFGAELIGLKLKVSPRLYIMDVEFPEKGEFMGPSHVIGGAYSATTNSVVLVTKSGHIYSFPYSSEFPELL